MAEPVDVVGLGCHPAHDRSWGGHVAVLGEAVVFAEPDVLPVVLVGENAELGLPQELEVLALAVMGGGAGRIAVGEDAELHRVSFVGVKN